MPVPQSYLRHRISFGVFPCYLRVFGGGQTDLWRQQLNIAWYKPTSLILSAHHFRSRLHLHHEMTINAAEPIAEHGLRRRELSSMVSVWDSPGRIAIIDIVFEAEKTCHLFPTLRIDDTFRALAFSADIYHNRAE